MARDRAVGQRRTRCARSARVPVPFDILTPEQFGELLQVSPKTVVAMCAKGRLPGSEKI